MVFGMEGGRSSSDLEGQVVLITGASSGLGEQLAQAFYDEGCRLIICGRRQNELERVRQDLLGSGRQRDPIYPPVTLQLDLEELDNLPAKMEASLTVYNRIDILVNNGGISFRGEVAETSLDVDLRLMKTNYFGAVVLTKAALPSMIRNRSGRIVMIGSVQSKLAIPFRSAYSASKHALQAFSDCLRAEVKKHGVRVTVVNPGYIRTSLSLNALTASGQRHGQMDAATESGLEPRQAALRVIQAIKSDVSELMLCSLFYRLVVFLRALLPGVFFWAMARRAAKWKKHN